MWNKRKLLIVDDNTMIRDLLVDSFGEDYEVHEAINGEEGLQAAERIRPDIILLDVNMPDMSGIQALRKLAHSSTTSKIPVIILTSSEYTQDVKNEAEKCANLKGFMSKLVSAETIKDRIKEVLKK